MTIDPIIMCLMILCIGQLCYLGLLELVRNSLGSISIIPTNEQHKVIISDNSCWIGLTPEDLGYKEEMWGKCI